MPATALSSSSSPTNQAWSSPGPRPATDPDIAQRSDIQRRACQALLEHQVREAAEPRDDAVEPERVQRLVLAEVLGQEPDGDVGADSGDEGADDDRPVHSLAGWPGEVARLQRARGEDHRRR